jgi:uncharacterized protein
MRQSIDEKIQIDEQAIADFCRRWKIAELSLFGSVLRDDFSPESDVDVLVVFEEDAPWSYWDWGRMTAELEAIFGRRVDLVEKRSIINPFRRHHILTNRRIIHRHAA